MVRAFVHAYRRHMDIVCSEPATTRTGFPAHLMCQIVFFKCATQDESALACCFMVVVAFVFQVRAVSMHHVTCKDMIFNDGQLEVAFYRLKGKITRRPHIYTIPRLTGWSRSNLCNCFSSGTQISPLMRSLMFRWQTVYNARFPHFTASRQTTVTTLDTVLASGATMSSQPLKFPMNGSYGG